MSIIFATKSLRVGSGINLSLLRRELNPIFPGLKITPVAYYNLENLWKKIKEDYGQDKDFAQGLSFTSTRVVCILKNGKIGILHNFLTGSSMWAGYTLEDNLVLNWDLDGNGFKLKKQGKNRKLIFNRNKKRYPELKIHKALIFKADLN